MKKNHNYCVIMAGGIGSRFWPMSRTAHPKQFHDILGTGSTLIQQTFERCLSICPIEHIYVVTSDIYGTEVEKQLVGIPQANILLEPSRKNTAPCIAYASHAIYKRDKDAVMMVAPSDHLVMKEGAFQKTIEEAIAEANASRELVTLGIQPSRPDTGYGYIQWDDFDEPKPTIKHVKTFTEKPNLELAREFVKSGEFCWNSGIFIWRADSIIKAFSEYLPEMNDSFIAIAPKFGTPEEKEAIERIYALCESISIDYGIMEKAKNVRVVLSDFGWSDLGTWGSLYSEVKKDKENNAVIGKNILLLQSSDNMVKMPENKLAIIQGLNEFIVVDTADVLLIFPKAEEQKIKQVVNDLKVSKHGKFL